MYAMYAISNFEPPTATSYNLAGSRNGCNSAALPLGQRWDICHTIEPATIDDAVYLQTFDEVSAVHT